MEHYLLVPSKYLDVKKIQSCAAIQLCIHNTPTSRQISVAQMRITHHFLHPLPAKPQGPSEGLGWLAGVQLPGPGPSLRSDLQGPTSGPLLTPTALPPLSWSLCWSLSNFFLCFRNKNDFLRLCPSPRSSRSRQPWLQPHEEAGLNSGNASYLAQIQKSLFQSKAQLLSKLQYGHQHP